MTSHRWFEAIWQRVGHWRGSVHEILLPSQSPKNTSRRFSIFHRGQGQKPSKRGGCLVSSLQGRDVDRRNWQRCEGGRNGYRLTATLWMQWRITMAVAEGEWITRDGRSAFAMAHQTRAVWHQQAG